VNENVDTFSVKDGAVVAHGLLQEHPHQAAQVI